MRWIMFIIGCVSVAAGAVLMLPRPTASIAVDDAAPRSVWRDVRMTVQTFAQGDMVPRSVSAADDALFTLHISTPYVTIDAPVFAGMAPEVLARGVGFHTDTAMPNADSGNTVLSGHRFIRGDVPGAQIFRHLNKVRIGDEVRLRSGGATYVYRVTQRKTVPSDATEILAQTEKPMLTLYTCTPLFTALRRLVYTAELERVEKG